MILLDTRDLPVVDRVEVFNAAMLEACASSLVIDEDPAVGVYARMGLWDFGQSSLFATHASGFRLTRTLKHIRTGGLPIVALALQTRGRGLFASLKGRYRTIASVAHAWGFSDLSYFSRKFHHAYGVLPRDWQRTTRRSGP